MGMEARCACKGDKKHAQTAEVLMAKRRTNRQRQSRAQQRAHQVSLVETDKLTVYAAYVVVIFRLLVLVLHDINIPG